MDVNEMVIRPLLANLSVIGLFMIPMITMRLFAEEKRSGTIELLATSPVRDIEVILGKWLAASGALCVRARDFGLERRDAVHVRQTRPRAHPDGLSRTVAARRKSARDRHIYLDDNEQSDHCRVRYIRGVLLLWVLDCGQRVRIGGLGQSSRIPVRHHALRILR